MPANYYWGASVPDSTGIYSIEGYQRYDYNNEEISRDTLEEVKYYIDRYIFRNREEQVFSIRGVQTYRADRTVLQIVTSIPISINEVWGVDFVEWPTFTEYKINIPRRIGRRYSVEDIIRLFSIEYYRRKIIYNMIRRRDTDGT